MERIWGIEGWIKVKDKTNGCEIEISDRDWDCEYYGMHKSNKSRIQLSEVQVKQLVEKLLRSC